MDDSRRNPSYTIGELAREFEVIDSTVTPGIV